MMRLVLPFCKTDVSTGLVTSGAFLGEIATKRPGATFHHGATCWVSQQNMVRPARGQAEQRHHQKNPHIPAPRVTGASL